MANIKGDLWFILQFSFRQRMRPITQMKNIPAVSESRRHLKLHKKKKEEEVHASSHDSVFWQDVLNLGKIQTLFWSQFSSPALIMSKAAAAEAESCFYINTVRQANSSISCFPHTALKLPVPSDESITDRRSKNPNKLWKPFSAPSVSVITSNQNALLWFRWQAKVSNKWRIPIGEVRGLLPFSLRFLSSSLFSLLKLPGCNLSPSATAAWL